MPDETTTDRIRKLCQEETARALREHLDTCPQSKAVTEALQRVADAQDKSAERFQEMKDENEKAHESMRANFIKGEGRMDLIEVNLDVTNQRGLETSQKVEYHEKQLQNTVWKIVGWVLAALLGGGGLYAIAKDAKKPQPTVIYQQSPYPRASTASPATTGHRMPPSTTMLKGDNR